MERLTSIQTIEHTDGTSHEQMYCFGHLWGPAFFRKGTKDYEEYMAIVKRLAEYEDLQDKLDKHFDGCVELEMIVDAIIKYDEQFNRDEKLSAAMLITNDSVRKYREWKDLDEQGLLLKNPEKLKHNILAIMAESAYEYRSYSESYIDYHGGRAEAMEAAMRIVKAEFSKAVSGGRK